MILPPFIAYYNTATHLGQMERRRGIANEVSPALVVILGLVIWLAMGASYVQEHLNRVWDSASMASMDAGVGAGRPPPPPPPPIG